MKNFTFLILSIFLLHKHFLFLGFFLPFCKILHSKCKKEKTAKIKTKSLFIDNSKIDF